MQTILPDKIGALRPISRFADNFQIHKARTETFKQSFIPSSIKVYNETEVTNRNIKYFSKAIKHNPIKLFNHGVRHLNIKHAQLRMKCSKLNFHLFLLHVSDSPACPCGYATEDPNHYLLNCPLYTKIRQIMLGTIGNITQNNIDVKMLLFRIKDLSLDSNVKIFDAVHVFMLDSSRLYLSDMIMYIHFKTIRPLLNS